MEAWKQAADFPSFQHQLWNLPPLTDTSPAGATDMQGLFNYLFGVTVDTDFDQILYICHILQTDLQDALLGS